MMSRKKFQPLSLESLKCKGQSWEDMDDDDSAPTMDQTAIARIRGELPNAPRASRNEQLVENIPNEGPFRLKISNLIYSVNEEQVEKFFAPVVPTKLSLVMNQNPSSTNRHRGIGYVDFGCREDLLEALKYSQKPLLGRSVNLDIAATDSGQNHRENTYNRDKRFNRGGHMGGGEQFAGDTDTNWRKRQPTERNYQRDQSDRQDTAYEHHRYEGSSFRQRRPMDNGSFKSSSMDGGEQQSEGTENWRKRQTQQHYDRNNTEDNRSFTNRGPPRGGGGGTSFDRSSRFTGHPAGRPQAQAATEPPPGFEPPKERPHIVLEKRTVEKPAENVPRSVAIFGSATPVNTTAIEERMGAKVEEEKQKIMESQRHASVEDENVAKPRDNMSAAPPITVLQRPSVPRHQHSSTSSTGDVGHTNEARPQVEPAAAHPRNNVATKPAQARHEHHMPSQPPHAVPEHKPVHAAQPTATPAPLRPAPIPTVSAWGAPPHNPTAVAKPTAPPTSVTATPRIQLPPHRTESEPQQVTSAPPPSQTGPRNPPAPVKPTEPPAPVAPVTTGHIRPHLSYSDMAKSKLANTQAAATGTTEVAPVQPRPSAAPSSVQESAAVLSGGPAHEGDEGVHNHRSADHGQLNHRGDVRSGHSGEGSHYSAEYRGGRGGGYRRGGHSEYQPRGEDDSGQSYRGSGYRGGDRGGYRNRGGRGNYNRSEGGTDERHYPTDSSGGRNEHRGGGRRFPRGGPRGENTWATPRVAQASAAQAE